MAGCLMRVLLLPLIGAIVYLLLSLRAPFPTLVFPAEGAEVAAIPAAILSWLAVLFHLDARKTRRRIGGLREQGFRDGGTAVASGRIEAQPSSLNAPFSGAPCVGYWYEISHWQSAPGGRGHWSTDFEGYALAPCAIRDPREPVKVLAAAGKELFHHVPVRELAAEEDRRRVERYLEQTDFGESFGLLGHVRKRETIGGPGSFRYDACIGGPPQDLRKCRVLERTVRPGETVLIGGVYSAASGGIAPDPDSMRNPFHIIVGGEAALRRRVRNRLIGAGICAGLSTAVVATYFLLFLARDARPWATG